jgi:two-component system nitrogen regulation response regulator GlnG
MGTQISAVSPEALRLIEEHSWPGNVRELENALIRAAVLSPGPILFPKDFTFQSRDRSGLPDYDSLSLEEIIRHKLEDYFERTKDVDLDSLYSLVIERVERPLIAQILGINRNTLRKKIIELHIDIKKP